MTLAIGEAAPEFSLPNAAGQTVHLSDLRGQWVVLYFYPKDMTPGCTTEAQEFRDLKEALAAKNAVVLGASKDSVARHAKFQDKEGLNFCLISDADADLCERYGVWQEKKNYGKTYMGIVRSTFLIDPEGKIAKVWTKVKVKGHAQAVFEAIP
ncbi:MAG: thioredoxin-dependent thiol peroxidase [Alphaproteobacteria bacterium CG_4_10_14_0_2_um_filter_63_37]|nr:MAG: peroxiredoxin [Proteobacteria bacterium CG1_02_64_396]PJA25813.1 MAG: thioredoxin-dependent thiol peroxidase [Alphaproteobacteria bacterium CG_4_10_14_0_2_um_filter_63_37]